MLSAASLMKAVILSGDENYHGESFNEYGIWDTPKTYLNQWNERRIVLSIDEPLPYFNGKTAFQISQYGFSYHESQHWTWFYRWLCGTDQAPVTNSTQIRNYTPGRFGLYRTLTGDDSQSAVDFFENTALIKNTDNLPFEEYKSEDEEAGVFITDYSDSQDFYSRPENMESGSIKIFIPVLVIAFSAALLLIFLMKKSKRE